jgi:hypothetical protein
LENFQRCKSSGAAETIGLAGEAARMKLFIVGGRDEPLAAAAPVQRLRMCNVLFDEALSICSGKDKPGVLRAGVGESPAGIVAGRSSISLCVGLSVGGSRAKGTGGE